MFRMKEEDEPSSAGEISGKVLELNSTVSLPVESIETKAECVPKKIPSKKLTIAFTYNLKPKVLPRNHRDAEFYAEFDTPETINGIKEAIEANGYNVIMVEAGEDAFDKFRNHREQIDLVFNFAEAVSNGLDREAHVPAMLEMLKIPYTGPSPLSAALILNKARAKEIWQCHGVPTAPFQVFYSADEKLKRGLNFPLIVKPIREGSSAGIRNKSVVYNEQELKSRVKEILMQFRQPAIAEKFLSGREFTVSLLGNDDKIDVLPIAEVNFKSFPEGVNKIDSYEAKWIWDDPKNPIEAIFCPAKIEPGLKKKIISAAKKAFLTLECKDWARVDIRLDEHDKPYVLELNCPVGLLPDPKENSRMPRAAREMGMDFSHLLGRIIKIALERTRI
jgi:D-alanine-D-alanine ligase